MTTFTMQDLTTETPEEKEVMDLIARQQAVEAKGAWENTDANIIQGATGAQYTPIDFKQFEKVATQGEPSVGKADYVEKTLTPPDLQTLFVTLTSTIQAIIKLSLDQQQQKQPVSSSSEPDLREAVSVVLEQAGWFKDMVFDDTKEHLENIDMSDDIQTAVDSEVENYFSYNFSLEDHVDISDMVQDAVAERLDEIVEEKLAEIIQDKLSSATITFN